MTHKQSLTPEEVIKAAYFHVVMKLNQHDVAVILNVNQGRIAEACVAMMYAANNARDLYLKVRANKEVEEIESLLPMPLPALAPPPSTKKRTRKPTSKGNHP